MKKKTYLLLLLTALTFVQLPAQIKVYDAPDVEDSKSTRSDIYIDAKFDNAVKFNFLSIASGVCSLDYERSIFSFLTAEAGIGITSTDFMEISNGFAHGYKYGTGFACHAGLRIFTRKSEDMTGFYFFALYKYRNYTIKSASNTPCIYNDKIGGIGMQFRLSNTLFFDCSLGMSVSQITKPDFTDSESTEMSNTLNKDKSIVAIRPNIAAKLGYNF